MKAHKRSELTPKQRPKVNFFLKVGKPKIKLSMKSLLLKGLFIISIVVLGFSSCKKDDNNDDPNSTPKYELRFTSTSNNPYKVEVAGHSDIISGHSYIKYDLEKNTYSWKVTQQSGYAIYPTVKDGTVTLDQDLEIVFP